MPSVMADCRAAELTDADSYRDPSVEALCAVADNTWTPPLTLRGGLYPLRKVWYLTKIEAGPKVRKPLQIEVLPTEDGAFQVRSTMLDIVGAGEDLAAATRDLCETIAAFWEEFSATSPDQLSPDATALFERLRNVLG
jgi:hypothetical protein